jgi:pimeloyl-ACP methyl ester carboxylesterase
VQTFAAPDGVSIAYRREGAGPPVLLIHGFAADHAVNWVQCGVVAALVGAGHEVVAMDVRGHGASGKPHDPAAYGTTTMAGDARALLDLLGWGQVDVAGYSMGGLITLRLLLSEPRVARAVVGGVGGGLLKREMPRAKIADALEADDASTVADASARAFRAFAESTGADRQALAAVMRGPQPAYTRDDLRRIARPVLVICGDGDTLVGSPHELADAIPGAHAQVVSGDHLSAVVDPAFAEAIVDFFADE